MKVGLHRFRRGLQVVARQIWGLPGDICGYQPILLERMEYDLYWGDIGEFEWLPPRVPIIAERIAVGASVLDLGCGEGALLAYLAQFRQARVTGMDVSERALDLSRQKGLKDLYQADFSAPGFELRGCYDYIIITEVLEHIPNPEELMNKLVGHFSKAVLVSIPNIGFFKHRLRLLFGRFPQQWGRHPGEHLRFWTLTDFEWWSGQLGYKVLEVVPTNGFPRLFRVLPGLFANQAVIVLRLGDELSTQLETPETTNHLAKGKGYEDLNPCV